MRSLNDRFIFWGLCVAIVFLPIYQALTSVGIGIACVFILIRSFFLKNYRQIFFRHSLLSLFVFIVVLSCVAAMPNNDVLVGIRKLGLNVLLFAAAVHTGRQEGRGRFAIGLFAATAVLVSLDGIYQLATGSDWFSARLLMDYPHLRIHRVTASFQQAGLLGIYSGVALPLVLSVSVFYPALWVFCIPLFTALVLSVAPGAGLGLITALGVLSSGWKKKRFFAAFLFCVVCLVYAFLPPMLTTWPDGPFFASIKERARMWHVAWGLVRQHPFLGNGLNTFSRLYLEACPPGYPFYHGGAPYAHNMYVQLLVETGGLGLGAFLIFLGTLISRAWSFIKARREELDGVLALGLLAGLSAYLTHGLLESSIQISQGAVLFWVTAGLLTGLTSRQNPSS